MIQRLYKVVIVLHILSTKINCNENPEWICPKKGLQKCYKMFGPIERMNWFDALILCREECSELLSVETKTEAEWISVYVKMNSMNVSNWFVNAHKYSISITQIEVRGHLENISRNSSNLLLDPFNQP